MYLAHTWKNKSKSRRECAVLKWWIVLSLMHAYTVCMSANSPLLSSDMNGRVRTRAQPWGCCWGCGWAQVSDARCPGPAACLLLTTLSDLLFFAWRGIKIPLLLLPLLKNKLLLSLSKSVWGQAALAGGEAQPWASPSQLPVSCRKLRPSPAFPSELPSHSSLQDGGGRSAMPGLKTTLWLFFPPCTEHRTSHTGYIQYLTLGERMPPSPILFICVKSFISWRFTFFFF